MRTQLHWPVTVERKASLLWKQQSHFTCAYWHQLWQLCKQQVGSCQPDALVLFDDAGGIESWAVQGCWLVRPVGACLPDLRLLKRSAGPNCSTESEARQRPSKYGGVKAQLKQLKFAVVQPRCSGAPDGAGPAAAVKGVRGGGRRRGRATARTRRVNILPRTTLGAGESGPSSSAQAHAERGRLCSLLGCILPALSPLLTRVSAACGTRRRSHSLVAHAAQKAPPPPIAPGCSLCSMEFKRRHQVPATVYHGAALHLPSTFAWPLPTGERVCRACEPSAVCRDCQDSTQQHYEHPRANRVVGPCASPDCGAWYWAVQARLLW